MKVIHPSESDSIRMDRRKFLVKSHSFDLFFWIYMKLSNVPDYSRTRLNMKSV